MVAQGFAAASVGREKGAVISVRKSIKAGRILNPLKKKEKKGKLYAHHTVNPIKKTRRVCICDKLPLFKTHVRFRVIISLTRTKGHIVGIYYHFHLSTNLMPFE